jgi:hypothetical protein
MGSSTGWNLGANWAIAGGVATKTAGAANNIDQAVLTVGKHLPDVLHHRQHFGWDHHAVAWIWNGRAWIHDGGRLQLHRNLQR